MIDDPASDGEFVFPSTDYYARKEIRRVAGTGFMHRASSAPASR